MISLETLAAQLEGKLNARLDTYGLSNCITPGVFYRFRIIFDTSDYKDSEREGNTATCYIHGVMSARSSDVEGVTEATYNASLDTTVEILVPFLFTASEGENESLLTAVRGILTDTLQASTSQMIQTDGLIFYEGASFSIATSGERAERPKVGDSYTVSVSINYVFVAGGVSSRDIAVSYSPSGNGTDWVRVMYTKLDMARQSTQDADVFSTAGSQNNPPSALSSISSTVFSLSMVTPTRISDFDAAANTYLLTGEVKPILMRLFVPTSYYIDENGDYFPEKGIFEDKTMCFSTTSLSAELDYNAGSTYTLVEYADLDRIIPEGEV